MDLASPNADFISVYIQLIGTLMFCLVFVFLWRQSGIVYFGLWGVAWAVQAVALVAGVLYFVYRGVWLAAYAFLEFAFAVLLVAAARAGFSGSIRNWKSPLKILLGFPAFLVLAYVLEWRYRVEGYHALQALVLGSVYFYNYASIRSPGFGSKVFRVSLLCLSVVFLQHAMIILFLSMAGPVPAWVRFLQYNRLYDFALHALLAFAAMAMWIENQHDRVRELGDELDQVRRESRLNLDLDSLTGLLNQSALARRMESKDSFKGVVSVCDMDNFKEVNDRYGHLVGDEILGNIGHLLRSSIRQEDEAFRWGGDEFVILFRNQHQALVRQRMHEIEERLQAFRVRGYGALPITFSWGTAEAEGRSLRETLDQADRDMYAFKRRRFTGKA